MSRSKRDLAVLKGIQDKCTTAKPTFNKEEIELIHLATYHYTKTLEYRRNRVNKYKKENNIRSKIFHYNKQIKVANSRLVEIKLELEKKNITPQLKYFLETEQEDLNRKIEKYNQKIKELL